MAPGATTDALETTSISIHFDRFLDPRSVIRQAVCLRSDTGALESFEDCSGAIGLTPTYDPVTRTATYYLQEGQSLEPGNLYRFTVFRPRDGVDFGFRAVDGAGLAETISIDLQITAAPNGTPVEAPTEPDAAPTCNDVRKQLKSCSACHDGTADGAAIMGLDLATVQGFAAATSRVARQTQVGGNADDPATKPGRLGAAMPLIDPRNPGNSYLLYKALVRYAPREETLADGELERLQEALVVGAGMPYNAQDPLSDLALETTSAWIAAGARCDL
ncbi:MAG: hypothetical protein U0271_07260 [Polyangiaceae bacterium]